MAYLSNFSCSIPNGPVLNGLSTVRVACMTFSLYVYTKHGEQDSKLGPGETETRLKISLGLAESWLVGSRVMGLG